MRPSFQESRSWFAKFRDAFAGIASAFYEERSFHVHLAFLVAVIGAGIWLRVSLVEGCLLGLCVTAVLVAEMMNTALEWMAREVVKEDNANVGRALDIGSGAVLLAAIGSAGVGGTIFVYRIGVMLGWWA